MSTMGMWVDNPLFVKHVRSRLRKGQFLAPAVVTGAICGLVAYSAYLNNTVSNGWAFGTYVSIQAITLGVMGSAQVSSAVGGARESGILDFHRVSPLPPLAVMLGFFFGAPVREYVLAAITLPFVLCYAPQDAPSFGEALQVEVATLLGCWLIHSAALLTALASKKPKAGTKGAIGVIVFITIIFGSAGGFRGMGMIAGAVGASPTLGFFGIPLPWLAFTALFSLPLLFFFLLASARKMRSDRAHAYTKPEAVAALGTEALLVLGAAWSSHDAVILPIFVIYIVARWALVLILTVTPNLGEFTKGFRRAGREGKTHLSYWDDLALNRVAVMAMCGVVLVAPTAAWYFIVNEGPRVPSFTIPIAVAVLWVAAFGLALQFFLLRFPRRGATLLGLFLFVTWFIPPVVGTILGVARASEQFAMAVVATSPIAGIAMSTELGPSSQTGTDLLKGAALIPALVFALLFNNGVTAARRRAIAEIRGGPAEVKPESKPDPLAA